MTTASPLLSPTESPTFEKRCKEDKDNKNDNETITFAPTPSHKSATAFAPSPAPVVASAFHPSLAPVGALLGALGYATGTVLAYIVGITLRGMAGQG